MSVSRTSLVAKKDDARQLLQNSRLQEARVVLLEVCKTDAGDVEAWHLLAAINGMLGQFAESADCSRRVIALQPMAPGAYKNLGNAQSELGRVDEARASFEQALAIKPDDVEALNSLGGLFNRAEDYPGAEEYCRKALTISPDNVEALNNLGVALQGLEKYEEALYCYQKALQINSGNSDVLYNAACAFKSIGRVNEALACISRMIRLAQNSADLLCKAGEFLGCVGKTDEAEHCYQRALSLQPECLGACNGLGTILAETGRYEQALECFQKLILRKPEDALYHANLGRVLERLRRNDDAREAASLALRLDPGNALAQLTLARLEKNESRFEEALQRLDAIIDCADEPGILAPALLLKGGIFDRLGDYRAAFEAFSKGKDSTRELCKRMAVDARQYIEYIDTTRDWISSARVEAWSVDKTERVGQAPVFFVAFPRSGTTLVEQALASTGSVATTSEKQIINQLIDELPALTAVSGKTYPECLNELSAGDILALRRRYWEIAQDHIGEQLDGKILVDKLPLNIVNIGFICRIFPDSKILFAVRDPRDVCLSCFMQAFALNPAMANFVSLEDAASLYAKVMELWHLYNSILELDVHVWRYEDLVSNFELQAKSIMKFLGVQWTDRILDFHRHASRSAINTPSYRDVATPIYTRSTQRWRNYEAELQPVIPVLEPYIRGFGYSLE